MVGLHRFEPPPEEKRGARLIHGVLKLLGDEVLDKVMALGARRMGLGKWGGSADDNLLEAKRVSA